MLRNILLCLCFLAIQLWQDVATLPPVVDPEIRAHLEAKVMSSMSLKDIEDMVENDDRVVNAPKSRIVIIPKEKIPRGLIGEDDREAIIIHRKPKSPAREEAPEYRFDDFDMDRSVQGPSYDSGFEPRFESEFRPREDYFSPLFRISDLESADSSPVRQFYESIVDSVMKKEKFGVAKDPFAFLEMAASEDVPQYKPRFDYDAYSQDSTETKLKGKPYWKDAPERRDETIDENGCRTVVKKIVDPEDEKKSGSGNAKSVIITKECESPNLNGPDAKITDATPLREVVSRYDSQLPSRFAEDHDSYESSRPEELDMKQTEGRDPIAPDYIDSMLEKHFKSFPGFSNPLSSFRGYQDRFKLRVPEAFKEVKPTVGVQTYEYSNPKSGFDEERQSTGESVSKDSPKTFEHHYHYDYPPKQEKRVYEEEPQDKSAAKSSDPKEPKMMKKSFAYYKKDNPKSDPNDQQYAEEYGHGNYRSFSSSYDSEKDGPKKQ